MTQESTISNGGSASMWRLTKLICLGTVIVSVLSCIVMAAVRSNGLVRVTVTALDAQAEPRDHNIPLVKQKDALPDYRITVNTCDRNRIDLGAKPNESATGGLTWQMPDPISTSDIASVRLDDQDKILADAIAEVQLTGESVEVGNYRFEFKTERSMSVGIQSFFGTPIGIAISAAFTIAILLMLVTAFAGIAG